MKPNGWRHAEMMVSAWAIGRKRGERWNVRPPRFNPTPEEQKEHDRFFPEDTEHVRWGFRFAGVAAVVAVVVVVGVVIVAVTL